MKTFQKNKIKLNTYHGGTETRRKLFWEKPNETAKAWSLDSPCGLARDDKLS